MKAPFLREPAHSPNFPQTTIRCHSVRVLCSPESWSFQLTLVARENRVWAVPLGVKRVSASLPRNPMSVMRFLQNMLCLLFVPLLLERPRASGSCSQGQGRLCWGRPSGGTDKAESRSRRAQGFDPEAEPNRRGQESGTPNCRERNLPIRFHRLDRTKHSNVSARNREGPQQSKLNDTPRILASERAVVLGKIVRRDGPPRR